MESLILDPKKRKMLLNAFLDYYNLHLSNFENLKTLDVLAEVLN